MTLSSQSDSSGPIAHPMLISARGLGAWLVRRVLAHLHTGRLQVELPSGQRIDYRAPNSGVDAAILIHKWRALRRLISGGDLGFARAYIDGDWSTPDLTAFIELIARNGEQFTSEVTGAAWFRLANILAHKWRANTRTGSRRNIEAHYDLGNDFYRQWLDESMLYSSAIFTPATRTLEQAQQEKIRQIIEMLELAPEHEVLEIGCGWGALAAAIATQAGATITGITLSPSQLAFANDMLERSGASNNASLRIEDYRDARGDYDRIVSIEMIEAVGQEYWPGYFGTLRDRLKPGGIAVIQAITITEARFGTYCARPDFIQRYIFPGGFLPTKSAMREAMADAGLRLSEQRNFGESYALTLAEWRRRFLAAWPEIEKLGFNLEFKRMWEYYLCYCEAGFKTGDIDVGLYAITHA